MILNVILACFICLTQHLFDRLGYQFPTTTCNTTNKKDRTALRYCASPVRFA